jgi:hypothetical protein
MSDFSEYYTNRFRRDMNRFFSTIPEQSKFHRDREAKSIFSIQEERLKPSLGHQSFLDNSEIENFAVSLYFSVFVDMVCYSEFKPYYEHFRKLTLYPKLIGNCMHTCRFHLHPSEIFRNMNASEIIRRNGDLVPKLQFHTKFLKAIPVMHEEMNIFFQTHLPEIDSNKFWLKCVDEFPCTEQAISEG